jgi:hypothetical protein
MSIEKDLCIGAKGKFRWTSTFEDLKKLVASFGFLNDSWSSPGGDCKMIESDDASLRWYASSGTLTIKGEKAAEIGSQLRTLIDNQAEEAIEGNIDRLLRGDERSIAEVTLMTTMVTRILKQKVLPTCLEINLFWMSSYML